MAYETIEMLIDGAWRGKDGGDGGGEDIINPATGEVLGVCPHASAAELDMALAAAEKGFEIWRNTSPLARQKVMEGAARILEDRIDAVAETLTREQGKPFGESKLEVGFVIDMFRWYGEEGKRVYGRIVPSRVPGARQMVVREPVGPVAAFVAWNFPGTNVIRKISGALGAGCSIIIKPSEETPGTAVAIARALQDAGLPDGVLNMVFGVPDTVSRHLLASPVCKKLSFTGSVPVGKHLQKLAADTLKRCTMELGGHAPVVVFDDADVEKAVKTMGGFKFRNAGQVCISPTRFFVQEKVYPHFVEGLTEVAKSLKVGNGMDKGVEMGPLIAERRIEVMETFLNDAREHGARITTGAERIGNVGSFFAPTVLSDVPDDAMIMNEEPFGPLAPVAPFKGIDDVLERANALSFGLASYVWTSNGATARAMSDGLNSGMVGVNNPAVSTPETPFGGVNESGYGSEGGIEGLEAYQRVKFVTEVGV
ncbi:NAD-dependent succinate-semialdehyde dehydrogenase [Pikeienuella piscinae]|uniref:NAD-dependent succinate-semialdehyde dehydrogenase n=1 Tax=Pikeienuella piscinae TaxID=2748098 RepID=A0A7L5BUD4_9RHOB|nr:NAD-dependent succinate-semialdehyde dehydrogenase [Pikeienuella piscinae]QIE55395.1 NAD-dependent succinate-semialdehyde dehydrogenase [Pikeienuella piscinae]